LDIVQSISLRKLFAWFGSQADHRAWWCRNVFSDQWFLSHKVSIWNQSYEGKRRIHDVLPVKAQRKKWKQPG